LALNRKRYNRATNLGGPQHQGNLPQSNREGDLTRAGELVPDSRKKVINQEEGRGKRKDQNMKKMQIQRQGVLKKL